MRFQDVALQSPFLIQQHIPLTTEGTDSLEYYSCVGLTQESFLEAHVIVFIVNQDWLDSIACNQEFEAMITRKMKFR